MKNHHQVGHFKIRLMMGLLSLFASTVIVGQSFAATTCSSCHGMPPLDSADGLRKPATGAFKGSHQKHVKITDDASECVKCHNNSGYDMKHANTAQYKIRMATTINGGSYSKGSFFNQTSMPIMGSCSNVTCHANVYGSGTITTPDWGTVSGCAACHDTHPIAAAGPNTGSHQKHYDKGAVCTDCHALGTTDTTEPSTNHADGSVNVTVGYSPSAVAKHAAGSGYASCSNLTCHSKGKFTPAAALWGSTLNCKGCHATLSAGHNIHISTLLDDRAATLSYTNYSATVSAGTTYKFGCANCHPVAIGNHLNGTIDVDLNTTAGSGSLKGKNPGGADYIGDQCTNVYCHSNGYNANKVYATTPVWGGSFSGDKCAACHGNSPNADGKVGSAAHGAHVIAIHADDIFNGVSRKLPIGGGINVNAAHGRNGRTTTINCNICHAATINEDAYANDKNFYCSGCHDGASPPGLNQASNFPALIANTSMHVNGKVEVAFINKKIATKAQVADSAFAAYTSANTGGWTRNSNGMKFKTYTSSYDVTKATLASSPAYTSGAGCAVACHSNIPVLWTATVTCTSCHTRLK